MNNSNQEKTMQLSELKQIFELEGEAFWQAATKIQDMLKDSAPSEKIRVQMDIEENKIAGQPWYRASSKKAKSNQKMLYIHGGGFFLEADDMQWQFCAHLADDTGIEVWFPQYLVAPKGNWQSTFEMLVPLYQKMLQETSADNIVFMGDSAGGSIVLSFAMYIRELGLAQPREIILISPSLTMELPESEEDKKYLEILGEKDPILSNGSLNTNKSATTISEKWYAGLPAKDYKVNPIHGKLDGLGHITLFTGTADVLNLVARQFKRIADENKIGFNYYEEEGATHCWVLMLNDKAQEAYRIVKDTINGEYR